MDPALFIALLNPAISLVLAAAFLALWMHQREQRYLAVLTVAYAGSAAGFLLQYFVLPIGFEWSRLLSCLAFTVAICGACGAVLMRYGDKIPYTAIGLLAGAGLAVFSWFLFVEPSLTWRIYAINFAFGGISLVVAAELRGVSRRGRAQTFLMSLALLTGANFLIRTLAIARANGGFPSYDGFYESLYWTTALLSHALLSLLLALTLLTLAAIDMIKELKADSHTDPLSQLLNRRGFEERADLMLERCNRAGFPVSLVLADLDHFKAVNDRHGHAAGDGVIVDFAQKLRMAAGSRGLAGRIGGEEFAVLLPLADLAAARLFAEAIRTLCAGSDVGALPKGVRVTASFGVSTRNGGERLQPLMRRADEALYMAKKNGRDSVRISYERPELNVEAQGAA